MSDRFRFFFIAITLFASPAMAENLIGKVVPPYPNGLISKQGGCFGNLRDFKHVCDNSFALLENKKGELLLIAAERFLHRKEGIPYSEIEDVIPYPKVPRNYLFEYMYCAIDGKADDAVLAVVKMTGDDENFSGAIWARKFDVTLKKFIEIPTEGVACINTALGAD